MLRPLLIIGVGGSGGKTIRAMKQALIRRLESVNYTDGLPSAWQFLQIDTTRDGIEFPAPMLDDDEIHLVVKSNDDFYSVLRKITESGNLEEQRIMLAGWGIANSEVSLKDGAGQIRAIGRQAGVADAKGILTALQNAIGKMKAPKAPGELSEIARKLDISRTSNDPRAFIISSLAGGSGAGMFVDIAELLKRATPELWPTETISFLYTSEVFKSLGKAGKDVAKNSLGAMNEITASKWVGTTSRTDLLFNKLGLASSANTKPNQFGPAGNILVGCRNKSGVDLSLGDDAAGMDEVFLTIGESLAGAFTNQEISEFYFNQAFVNIVQRRSSIDKSGLAPDPGSTRNRVNETFAASSIGFGQLSLGADRIVEFVADALTKRQVKKLLFPDLDVHLFVDGARKQDIVDKEAENIWPNFLKDSQLSEKGSENQIIDALFPEEWEKKSREFVISLIKKSTPKEKAIPLQNFTRSLWAEWETESEDFLSGMAKEINSKARKWVPEIQNHFRNQVAHELTQSGYAIVTTLVQQLRDQLKNEVVAELRSEQADYAAPVQNFSQAFFFSKIQEYAEGITGVSEANKPFLEKVSKFLTKVPGFQIQSRVLDLAASLVEDMLKNFFEPLLQSLLDARYQLEQDQKSNLAQGSKKPFNSYPEWGSGIVPKRYLPRSIERILIDPADFEKTYEYYAGRDAGGQPPFPTSINYSLLGQKMNTLKGQKNDQNLVTVATAWGTTVRDAQETIGAASSRVSWNFQSRMETLGERNRRWLKDVNSAFGKFTMLPIREYVNEPGATPEIVDEREKKFVVEFGAMLNMAQPLALFNDRAFSHIIGSSDGQPANGILPRTDKIPFAAKSKVGVECTTVLQNAGINVAEGGFAGSWFDPSSDRKAMYATTTTQASLPAWAFASLTEPILGDVAEAQKEAGTWSEFWNGRRSRPLLEAIPFETQIRKSIITGWFVASLFGLREVVSDRTVGREVKIWNPTLQIPGFSTFPAPLLNTGVQDVEAGNWVLPQLLTSAGIALAEFGKTGNLENLNGYQLLKFLGREVTSKVQNRDTWDDTGKGDLLPTGVRAKSNYLEAWIETGTLPSPNRELLKLLSENLSISPSRRDALIKTVDELRADYALSWQSGVLDPWYLVPETWELKDDIEIALSDIRDFALQVGTAQHKTRD